MPFSIKRDGKDKLEYALELAIKGLLVLCILFLLSNIIHALVNYQISSIYHGYEARIQACKTQIAVFEVGLDLFEIDCGRYPTNNEGLGTLIIEPHDLIAGHWRGPYYRNVKKIPLDPWGNAFVYICPGQHNPLGYDLQSRGPDGILNTFDDLVTWDDYQPTKESNNSSKPFYRTKWFDYRIWIEYVASIIFLVIIGYSLSVIKALIRKTNSRE